MDRVVDVYPLMCSLRGFNSLFPTCFD